MDNEAPDGHDLNGLLILVPLIFIGALRMPLLLVLACACFVSGLAIRMLDPVVPAIAIDLATAEANVSLLASAYAIPYALIQPVLGPIGDRVGKTRVIKLCLLCLALATAMAAAATSLEMMLAARVLGGLAGGGIIPLAIASIGDHVPFEQRQVALSKILTAMIGAVLVGTIGTGFVAELIGWRGVIAVAALITGGVYLIALANLREPPAKATGGAPRSSAMRGYGVIFANRLSYICYGAVFVEGVLILGLLPYVASMLSARGAGGIFEAGLVLAGMAIGGLIYTQIAARLIGPMGGVANLIRLGGVLAALGYFGIAMQSTWAIEMAAFVLLGFGFYSIHNSLQTQATELAPDNRGAAVALHAFFFFLGQSIGPLFYAVALAAAAPSNVIAAIGVAAFVLAMMLAQALKKARRTA